MRRRHGWNPGTKSEVSNGPFLFLPTKENDEKLGSDAVGYEINHILLYQLFLLIFPHICTIYKWVFWNAVTNTGIGSSQWIS